MSFVAIHRTADTSLATTRWHLTGDEVTACESAVELLERLQQLNDRRSAELDAAVSRSHEAGYAAGRDEALNTIAPCLIESWQQCADKARLQSQTLRQAVVLLSRDVVQRIASAMAPADVVAALALRATQDMLAPQAVIVRVHPDLEEAVRKQLEASGRSMDALEVRADPALDLLACDLDTPQGRLIAGLQTQLDNLVRVLVADASDMNDGEC